MSEEISMPVYIPVGHGYLATQGGDYVYKRVPKDCLYITLAFSGEIMWNHYVQKLLNGLKDPDILYYLHNPMVPENYVALKKYFEPITFPEMTVPNVEHELNIREKGSLTISFPGDIYPESEYVFSANFLDNHVLIDSGFYLAETLAVKDLTPINANHAVSSNSRDSAYIKKCFAGSLIPTAEYIMEQLGSDTQIEAVEDAARRWPNPDATFDVLPNLIKTRDLIAAPKKGAGLKAHLRASLASYNKIIKNLDDIGLDDKAPFPIVLLAKQAIEEVARGDGSVERLTEIINEIAEAADNREYQYPGEPIMQSFLFENFPGIHVNFLCRETIEGVTPNVAIAQRRRSNLKRRIFDVAVAKGMAGMLPLTVPQEVRYLAERERQRASMERRGIRTRRRSRNNSGTRRRNRF